MRITVFGAGAVGGYLAWGLGRSGHEVSVIARGAHLEAIRRDGLRLDGPNAPAEATRFFRATDDPATLGAQDAVFVTLKHPGIAPAIGGFRALAGPGTRFVFITNGIPWWMESRIEALDPGGALAALIPPAGRIGGVAKFSAEVTAPGVVTIDPTGARFQFGASDAAALAGARELVAVLASTGLAASLVPDIRQAVWNKLFLNVCFSLPSAVLGLPVGVVSSQREVAGLLVPLFHELQAVALAHGVDPGIGIEAMSNPATLASPHKPSILQDLERGRPAEIDALVTAPIRLARRKGIDTPVLDQLGRLITAKARILGCYDGAGAFGDERSA